MKARFWATISFAGAIGLSGPALAQPDDDIVSGIPVHVVDASGDHSTRLEVVTFDLWTNALSSGLVTFLSQNTGKHVLEDINFASGPWESQTGRVIDAIDFGVWGATGTPFGLRITIYDPADVDFAGFNGVGTPMINASATPLRVMEFGEFSLTNTGAWYPNTPLPGGPLALSDALTGVVAEMQIIDTYGNPCGAFCDGALLFTNNSTSGEPTGLPENYVNPAAPGHTTPSYGRDTDNNSIFTGAATSNAVTGERRHMIFANPQLGYVTYGCSLALRGDIAVTPPACISFTLGPSNAFASESTVLPTDGVAWYCVTLPSDATDTNGTYLDLDTYGSSQDVAIGLFNSEGIKIAQNDESGGAGQALLSSGIGRRANTNGGADYQGWTYLAGHTGLPAGTYYVAIASAGGGASFSDGFLASGSGPGGSATLRVRTNVADGALNPSDPPTATRIVGPSSEDPIVFPGGIVYPTVPEGVPGVHWYDVQLCRDADDTFPVHFQVFSYNEPVGKGIYVFDASGNLKGSAVSATSPYPETPTVVFGGGYPGLEAGRYYICLALNFSGSDVDLAPNPETNGRWHVRPRVNSGGYTLGVWVDVQWPDCPDPVSVGEPSAVTEFALAIMGSGPNLGEMSLEYTVARATHVRLSVYDVQGRRVALLADGEQPVGRYQVAWDGSVGRGRSTAGVYFVRYEAAGSLITRRVVLM